MQPPKSKRVELIAAKLPRYAGKALKAGQAFYATPAHAKLLTTAKLATYPTRDQARAPMLARQVAPLAPEPDASEVATLRADYENLAGRKPHNFWKADRLRAEIDKLLESQTTPDDVSTSDSTPEGDA